MPRISDTYARAYQACGEILSTLGRFPTIELVRERIGTNSPALIKRAINDWTAALAVETRERLQRPGVPEALLNAAEQSWRLAQNEAERALAEHRAALERERQALLEEWETVQAAHAALDREFDAYRQGAERERGTLQTALTQQKESLREARDAVDRLNQELATAREANAQLTGSLAEAKAAHAQALEDWQARFDHDHRWHLLRIEEEKERARQTGAEALAQRENALQAAQRRGSDAEERLARATQQAHELQGEQRLLQADRERLQQANAALSQTVADLQAQLQARSAACERLQRALTQAQSSAVPQPRTTKRRKLTPPKR